MKRSIIERQNEEKVAELSHRVKQLEDQLVTEQAEKCELQQQVEELESQLKETQKIIEDMKQKQQDEDEDEDEDKDKETTSGLMIKDTHATAM